MSKSDGKLEHETQLRQATGITAEGAAAISGALNAVLADLFALYVKTKNFHWHMTGAHFRDYHLLLDEQGPQVLSTIDPAAERVRKMRQSTLRSVGHITRLQRTNDNDAEDVTPADILAELRDDNTLLVSALRDLHDIDDDHGDIVTTSLFENWTDGADGRVWFLAESTK
jgi:starvation-inducible DNA-binding protein